LVSPRDCHALTKGILELLKDPEKRKQMGEKGKQRALQHFEVERMVKEYASIYDACIVSQLKDRKISAHWKQ